MANFSLVLKAVSAAPLENAIHKVIVILNPFQTTSRPTPSPSIKISSRTKQSLKPIPVRSEALIPWVRIFGKL